MKFFPALIVLPYLANTAGWLLTEVGRYPWVVNGLITLQESVSVTVSAGMVWFSLIGYILIYSLLIFATIYLMRKYARAGAEPLVRSPERLDNAMPSLVPAQD